MSDVLAYDCAGRPLRAGDRVRIIQSGDVRADAVGRVGIVRGIEPSPVCRELARLNGVPGNLLEYREECTGRFRCGGGHSMQKLGDRPDTGTWEEVTRATGWQPGYVREEVEA